MQYDIIRLQQGGELAVPESNNIYDGYKDVDVLLNEAKEPAIILLDGLDIQNNNMINNVFQSIYKLRRSPVFYAAPIIFTKSIGNLDSFADNVSENLDHILSYGSEILSGLKSISVSKNAMSNDLRLLTFSYCRKNLQLLTPVPFLKSAYVYEYPAAVLIGGFAEVNDYLNFSTDTNSDVNISNGSTTQWLNSLLVKGLLAPKELIDRIRNCPYCHTSSLNYIDTCPLCGSINFEKKKMIHCFTCGHVSAQEDFRNGMTFKCPRCDTTLRHIGADYDRPLESYDCNNCGEKFIDPDVKTNCLRCGRSTTPDELNAIQLYSFELTSKGERAVQLGVVDFEVSLFDENNNVIPAYFYQVCNWLLRLRARYKEEDFSLVCIKILEKPTSKGALTSSQLDNIFDEFNVRVKELIRSTDITTNTGGNTFWLLLPRTPYQSGEVLVSKIQKIIELISMKVSEYIEIQVKCFSIPTGNNIDAEKLLKDYEGEFLDR